MMDEKLSGVYAHHVDHKKSILFRGFDDVFYVPHSRYTTVNREDIEATKGLKILASSDKAGVYAVKTKRGRQVFLTGHSEYDADTLNKEYTRDKNLGINPKIPENYFPSDDDTKAPVSTWRGHATLLFTNWLNYFVYQTTPYDIMKIKEIK
jgi:homoserine O-succinyltransferase